MYCTRCKKEHFETSKMCSNCKEKNTIKLRKYRKNNIENLREYDRKRRAEDPEKFRERDKLRFSTKLRRIQDIKHGAKRRNISFELEDEYAMALTDESCFYCSIETTEEHRNGIDRLDNTVGYTISNCVSCCGTCNFMKRCLDAHTFVERCSQVSLHNGHTGKICEYWDDIKGYAYGNYKWKQKTKDFQLSKCEYEELRHGDCTYCGRSCTETHTNGIDRVDNSIGYVLDNCASCCGSCNISKGTSSADDFVSRCVLIASREHTIPEMPRSIHIFVRNRPNM